VETIEKLAAADHRDRTSMLNKIIAFYLDRNPPHNGKTEIDPMEFLKMNPGEQLQKLKTLASAPPHQKKKAGTR
jgi:hypothetical protein